MNDSEQVRQLGDELDRLINRFRQEYDMTYAAVVGVLEMKKHLLCEEAARLAETAGEEDKG